MVFSLSTAFALLAWHYYDIKKATPPKPALNAQFYIDIAKRACKNTYLASKSMSTMTLLDSVQDGGLTSHFDVNKEHNLTAIANFGVYYGAWEMKENVLKQQALLDTYELLIINPSSRGIANLTKTNFPGKCLIASIDVNLLSTFSLDHKSTHNKKSTHKKYSDQF